MRTSPRRRQAAAVSPTVGASRAGEWLVIGARTRASRAGRAGAVEHQFAPGDADPRVAMLQRDAAGPKAMQMAALRTQYVIMRGGRGCFVIHTPVRRLEVAHLRGLGQHPQGAVHRSDAQLRAVAPRALP